MITADHASKVQADPPGSADTIGQASSISGSNLPVSDLNVTEVWDQLKADPTALLIDVRTRAEWTFVGLPDLSSLGKRVVTVEWQTLPEHSVEKEFSVRLNAVLTELKADTETPLFFICRSGTRSRMAAEAMKQQGYHRCANVADGFEGPLDAQRHRGSLAGWKAAGLAWIQG